MLITAIKGFNREWAAVTSIRDNENNITGWKLQTKCGIERKFPNAYWNDPYGAAVHAIQGHRCK